MGIQVVCTGEKYKNIFGKCKGKVPLVRHKRNGSWRHIVKAGSVLNWLRIGSSG